MAIDLSRITRVRYIKLGDKGRQEMACIRENFCYIGFCSSDPDCFHLMMEAKNATSKRDKEEAWKKVWDFHFHPLNSQGLERRRRQNATSATNQLRYFFESGEETLWITFHARKLYYAILDPSIPPRLAEDGSHRSVLGQWRCTDIEGNEFLEEKLSGRITQTKSYRGTSCKIADDAQQYLLRRIRCQLHPYQKTVVLAMGQLSRGITAAIRSLTPGDFELLVELIFSQTLRRISTTGKVQDFVDLVFENPLDESKVSVQVKSRTTPAEFHEYATSPDLETYQFFYFVYHSSESLLEDFAIPSGVDGTKIKILDISKIASMAIDVGLISWVIDKAG